LEYKIVEKPSFEIIGKSREFTHDNFFKEAPKFWKDYVTTEEYQTLWHLTCGEWGEITRAPLMSIYIPRDTGDHTSFMDILGIEKTGEIESDQFEVFKIPASTYAEFTCTYKTSVKTNKYIYGEWLPSMGYERDESKVDIAAYYPVAFLSTQGMGVRWWIPIKKRS